MEHIKLTKFLLFLTLIFSTLYAQTGTLSGKLVDGDFGEGLIGANIVLIGTTYGAATDISGNYTIKNIPVGSYSVKFSSIGYQTKTVTNVEIKSGEITKIGLTLSTEAIETDEVVVTAKALSNTEASMLVKRQKSITVSDAISAEQFSKSGSSDAAEAIKQVVGASVVDGKYVYVRGLGERYSSTQLNGAELPSSDPNRKAFQLDLLPTNLLDNIVTIKTFTPDRPGNFSGGIVDVGTKSFPDKFTFKLSASSSFNSNVGFSNDFLSYDGGDKDWLGYDDGTRDLPEYLDNEDLDIPNEISARRDSELAEKLDRVSNAFNSTMSTKRISAPINQSYSLSIGDQVSLGEFSSFGFMGSFTYGRSHSYYEGGQIGVYKLNQGSDVLNNQLNLSDSKGTSETSWGGLAAFAFNINPEHQIGGNIFYSRSGISTARYQEGHWPQELDDRRIVTNDVLGYLERDIQSYQLRGEHSFTGFFDTKMDWNVSVAQTTQKEPDLRLVFSIIDPAQDENDVTNYTIVGSNFDNPSRYFRDLKDNNNTYNLNFEIPFSQWYGLKSKVKFGGTFQQKDRMFNERIFTYQPDNRLFNDVNGDISQFFSSDYNGIVGADTSSSGRIRYTFGNTLNDNSKERNNYSADEEVAAGYMMFEIPIFRNLKFVGGARYETTKISLSSADTTIASSNIDEQDLLPSLNLIYNVAENMNIRLAATQTLARPNFREIAPFSSKEFVNGYDLIGNPELKRTLIENFDLRWEYFLRPGEIIGISGFYKKLKNPIERTFAVGSTESNRIITFTNVEEAVLLGAEFEARVNLDYISDFLRNFSFGTNLSIVHSTIDIPEKELEDRKAINPDAEIEDTRELQGQSPYILNVDLSYNSMEAGLTASLHYNIFGERLSKVSTNLTPDVYEQPMQQLDFVISKEIFGLFRLKLSAKNILDSSFREVYKYNGSEYVFQEYKKGVSYSLGFSYSL